MSNPGPAVTNSAHPSNVSTNQALRLLGVARGVSVTATGNVSMQINNSTVYLPTSMIVTNSNNAGTSVSAASAALSIYTGSGATGSEVFASTTLANCTTNVGTQVVTAFESTTAFTAQNLFINVGTASSNVGTVDVYVYGYDFSTTS